MLEIARSKGEIIMLRGPGRVHFFLRLFRAAAVFN